jgi:hypothetical protein
MGYFVERYDRESGGGPRDFFGGFVADGPAEDAMNGWEFLDNNLQIIVMVGVFVVFMICFWRVLR